MCQVTHVFISCPNCDAIVHNNILRTYCELMYGPRIIREARDQLEDREIEVGPGRCDLSVSKSYEGAATQQCSKIQQAQGVRRLCCVQCNLSLWEPARKEGSRDGHSCKSGIVDKNSGSTGGEKEGEGKGKKGVKGGKGKTGVKVGKGKKGAKEAEEEEEEEKEEKVKEEKKAEEAEEEEEESDTAKTPSRRGRGGGRGGARGRGSGRGRGRKSRY